MKRLRIFLGIVFLLSAAAWAMPPHPDLAMKVRAFDVTIPYAMANRAELLARGVDAPQAFDLSGKFGASGRLDDTEMRVLILLATFSDHHYQTSATYFDSLIFGNQMGDMRHFYHEISYGEFHVTAGQTPSEIGWTDMPQTYAYYVDGANGFGNYPQNAQGLVVDLVNLVDPYVDFSVYDNNGDQYVDGLMVIHTGPGAEYTGSDNDIWSHAWSVPSQYAPYVDEVWVRNYSMEPEYWRSSGDMTCGVFAHEFGHQLGLPDLYDTDYSSEGVGDFSLMAGGSWNGTLGSRPAHMDAWCKTQVGFATATVLSENTTGIEIPCSEFSPVIYRVWRGGVGTGNEYFLIENRSSYGYSIGMHGITGLFIWHIDNSVSSNRREWYPGHTSSGHFLVALEQADGEWDLERNFNSGDGSDPYPGYSDNRTFSNSSLPNSMDYSFTPTDVLITNISDVDSTMTFDLSFAPQPYVLVQNPNGGEIWPIGTSVTIEIERYVTTNPAVISLSRNGGETWTQLFTLTGADTTWTVTGPTTTLALLKAEIFGADTLTDVSDNTFVIGETVLTLLHPNGGESISQNTPYQVTWDSYGYSGLISLFLNRSYPDGEWEPLDSGIANTGSRYVRIPGPASDLCRMKIVADENPEVYDESAENFYLIEPTITLISPNGGEEWTEGETDTLRWSSEFLDTHVSIYLSRNGDSGPWETILTMTQNDGMHAWNVTGPWSHNCRIRIQSRLDSTVVDMSDADFIIHPSASADEPVGIPHQFGLVSVYPNPFNSVAEIRFALDRPGRADVRIFDVLGREVERLKTEATTPGIYQVSWIPQTGSGLYFVQLQQGERRDMMKLVYLK